jgi:hypothetical protein
MRFQGFINQTRPTFSKIFQKKEYFAQDQKFFPKNSVEAIEIFLKGQKNERPE